jgi:peptidoglycan-N-acetylglucosamine deacetylase
MEASDADLDLNGAEPQSWPFGSRAALCLCVDVSEPPADERVPSLVPEPWYERAGSDRLVRVLADIGVSATFTWNRPTAISIEVIAQVMAAGHEVAARVRDDHGQPNDWATDLSETRSALARRTETAIVGCKAVGQFARPALRQVVHDQGFQWLMDQPYGDMPILLRPDGEGAPLVHLPTSRWFDDRRLLGDQLVPARQVFEVWRDDLDVLRDEGGLMCLTLHPSISGRPGASRAVALLLDHAVEAGDIWIAPAGAIAAWWLEQHSGA